MNIHILWILLFLSSCATKYLVPGNRFITPESQGQALLGSIELQQTGANLLKINTGNGTVDDGVIYEDVTRTGFLFSNSLFNQFDILWSHTGGSNSMLGGKFQFIGEPRVAKAAGHKASIAVMFGGNEHESDDESIEFELSGREYLALYGYRFTENILPYVSVSMASYNFSGTIRTNNALNGLEPKFVTESRALNAGVEFSVDAFFAKVEATYQQLKTDDTKDRERFVIGYSVGLNW